VRFQHCPRNGDSNIDFDKSDTNSDDFYILMQRRASSVAELIFLTLLLILYPPIIHLVMINRAKS